MTNEEIRELLALFNDSGVAEMEVQRGENRVRFRRGILNHEFALPATPLLQAPPVMVAQAAALPMPPTLAGHKPVAPATPEDNNEVVKSPIVGTFYECPSPGAPAFVNVGDRVEKGQILCIIESMKLMNEIESEVSGTVVARLVESGRPVEYGEGLFLIKAR